MLEPTLDHLCTSEHSGLAGGMRELYGLHRVCATSEHADIMLIRSHVAYWSGIATAERLDIRPSRGHSYKLREPRSGAVVAVCRVSDPFDHREGVTGWRTRA